MAQVDDILLDTDLEHLWARVQLQGRKKEDRRVVEQLVDFNDDLHPHLSAFGIGMRVSADLFAMVAVDVRARFMFWDALCMWINYFHTCDEPYPDDVRWVILVAQAYIESN